MVPSRPWVIVGALAVAAACTRAAPAPQRPRRALPDAPGLLAGLDGDDPMCGNDQCEDLGGALTSADLDESDADRDPEAALASLHGGFTYSADMPSAVEAYTPTATVAGAGDLVGRVFRRRPGDRGPAAGTVVYLDDIGVGKQPAALGGILELHRGRLSPHIQIASPIGVTLVVAADESGACAFEIAPLGAPAPLRESLPAGRHLELPLVQPGFYRVRCAPAPGEAWIIVPRHPYYTITDEAGSYRLDDIPAGDYQLVAWREPEPAHGAGPRESRQRVRILAGQPTVADVHLK